MNSFVIAFFAVLAVAHAGVLAPAANIIQGPSSRTTVVGPDGSAISSVQPGGQIITEESSGVLAHTAPVVAAAPAIATYAAPAVAAYSTPAIVNSYAAPALAAYSVPAVHAYSAHYGAPVVHAYSAPVVSAYSAPIVSAYSAPLVAASGVVAQKSVDTVIAGPSGTISTGKTTLTAPAVVAV